MNIRKYNLRRNYDSRNPELTDGLAYELSDSSLRNKKSKLSNSLDKSVSEDEIGMRKQR